MLCAVKNFSRIFHIVILLLFRWLFVFVFTLTAVELLCTDESEQPMQDVLLLMHALYRITWIRILNEVQL